MSPFDYVAIGAVLALGSVVQAAIGFAFGLIVVPLLLTVGLPLPEAIAVAACAMTAQTGRSLYLHRDDVGWRELAPYLVVSILFLGVGVVLLDIVAELPVATLKQGIGVIVLLVVVVNRGLRIAPRERIPAAWGVLAASLGGILGGLVGMGGPPLVLWIVAHKWSSARIRATMWAFWLSFVPVQIALLTARFGAPILGAAATGFAFLPVVLVAAAAGLWLGSRIPAARLRDLVHVLLCLLGLSMFLAPFVSG